jgi:Holliday junction resolvase RusA-like endonuclease
VFPFEFTINGTPVSQQCRRRSILADWRRRILAKARQRDPGRRPIGIEVLVTITYYYVDRALDIDNLAKPICDALKGFVYDDDGQIVELLIRKRRLNETEIIEKMSQALEEALETGEEFVHVVVEAFRSAGTSDDQHF